MRHTWNSRAICVRLSWDVRADLVGYVQILWYLCIFRADHMQYRFWIIFIKGVSECLKVKREIQELRFLSRWGSGFSCWEKTKFLWSRLERPKICVLDLFCNLQSFHYWKLSRSFPPVDVGFQAEPRKPCVLCLFITFFILPLLVLSYNNLVSECRYGFCEVWNWEVQRVQRFQLVAS